MNSEPAFDHREDWDEEVAHEEESEQHVDERWLISYSDMMTLLFGLFVMLYSMANKFDVVQKSASKQFAKEDSHPKVEVDPAELETLKQKAQANRETEAKLARLTAANEQLKTEVDQQKKDLDQQKSELADLSEKSTKTQALRQTNVTLKHQLEVLQAKVQVTESSTSRIEELQKDREKMFERLTALQNSNKSLTSELKDSQSALSVSQEKVAKLTPSDDLLKEIARLKENAKDAKDMKDEVERLRQEQQALQARLDTVQTDNKTLQSELTEARQQLKAQTPLPPPPTSTAQSLPVAKRFAAVVINWPTQNHDIDLIITDPMGQVFNYKHRSEAGHPGKFVLDTRRGPGAEMWQTDKILPGTYKIKYVFYNTYGNNEPVSIFGNVYSAAGSFELPKVKLNFNSQREKVFEIRISESGEVSLAN